MTTRCATHGCALFEQGSPERQLCEQNCRLALHALAPAPAPAPPALVLTEGEAELLTLLVSATKSPSTRRKYLSSWRTFTAWAAGRGAASTPPVSADVLLAYCLHRAPQVSPSALAVDLAAIRAVHEARGVELRSHPQLRAVLAGHRRTWGRSPRKAAALRRGPLTQIVEAIPRDPTDVRAVRDRALILVGFAGAFRRSELAALRLQDLAFEPEGVVVTLQRSKTDQEGRGRRVMILPAKGTACPVTALKAWLAFRRGLPASAWLWSRVGPGGQLREAPPTAQGGLTGEAVALVLRQRCADAGLDESSVSGHSLRRGWITEAAVAGASTRDIQRQTGHRDARTTAGYIDDAAVLTGTPRVL